MRALMLPACVTAVMAGLIPLQIHAADIYAPSPGYGAAPPPAYRPPPAYGYAPPPVYVRPPGVIAAPEGPAYVVPGPVYQPGDEYVEAPVAVDARRYYRDCWWEWGYRRCALRPRWW